MGNKLLWMDGFYFIANQKRKKIFYWECQLRRSKKCRARLHTNSDLSQLDIFKVFESHNHERPIEKQATVTRRTIQKRAQRARLALLGDKGNPSNKECEVEKEIYNVVVPLQDIDTTNVKIVNSRIGTKMLWMDGFYFIVNFKTKNKFRWECQYRKTKKCRARLQTNSDLSQLDIFNVMEGHNHERPIVKQVTRRTIQRRAQLAKLALQGDKPSKKKEIYHAVVRMEDINTTNVRIVTSKMGKKMLWMDGFYFILNKKRENNFYWVCQYCRHQKCRARLHTNSDLSQLEILKVIESHNHERPKLALITRKTLNKRARRAKLLAIQGVNEDDPSNKNQIEVNDQNHASESEPSCLRIVKPQFFSKTTEPCNLGVAKHEPSDELGAEPDNEAFEEHHNDDYMDNDWTPDSPNEPISTCPDEPAINLCLICNQKERNVIAKARSAKTFTSPIEKESEEILSQHLWSFFVLRKMLDLPPEECSQLLSQLGSSNPGDWFILCRGCCTLAQDAYQLHCQINKLVKKLTSVKKSFTTKLSQSVRKEGGNNESTFDAVQKQDSRDVIRRYLKDNHCSAHTMNEDDISLPINSPPASPVSNNNGEDFNDISYEPEDISLDDVTLDVNDNDEEDTSDDDTKILRTRKVVELNLEKTPNWSPQESISKTSTGYKCKLCPYTSSKYSTVYRHINCHKHTKTQCHLCNFPIFTNLSMELHMKKYHTEKVIPKTYNCDKCSYTSKLKADVADHNLRTHKRLEHVNVDLEQGTYSCKLCPKVVDNQEMIVRHIGMYHFSVLGLPDHLCHICAKSFRSARTLRGHIQHHHGTGKQFKCDVCEDRWFHTMSSLKLHKLSHMSIEERPTYMCDQCGSSFLNVTGLRRHKKVLHSFGTPKTTLQEVKEDPEPGASSSVSARRGAHLRKDKYQCKQCDKVCLNGTVLFMHMKKVHPELFKFKCDACHNIFSTRKTLRKHIRTVHAEMAASLILTT